MKFKDKEALKQLKLINHYELNESIATFPENERDGRNDLQILLTRPRIFGNVRRWHNFLWSAGRCKKFYERNEKRKSYSMLAYIPAGS